MIASFLKSIGRRLIGYFLNISCILFGVVSDDIHRLCHMEELRKKHRAEYLEYQRFVYDLFVSGISHDGTNELTEFKTMFDKLSVDERKVIRVDDRLYGRMRRVLYWQLVFDALMSFALTVLFAFGCLFGVRFVNSDLMDRVCEMLGM